MHCSILKINFHFFTFNMSATIHCFPFMCNYFNLNSCTKYLDSGKAPGHFPGQNLFFFLCFFIFLVPVNLCNFKHPVVHYSWDVHEFHSILLAAWSETPWEEIFSLIPTLKQNVKWEFEFFLANTAHSGLHKLCCYF